MFRFSIDRGGTFTDVYAEVPGGEARVHKLLSEDPANYPNAPREGIRRILEEVTGIPHPRGELVDASRIEWIRMGTTVATNGLLEREGSRFVLVTTKGFKDALEIGTQARPDIFDIAAAKLPVLYESVVEAVERVRVATCETVSSSSSSTNRVVVAKTGDEVEIVTELDVDKLRSDLEEKRGEGFEACAIAFAHSYAYPDHEVLAGSIARELGFTQVSVSSELLPMARLVPRGQTACVDAYLTPLVRAYLESFVKGFRGDVLPKVLFMQSDGGLVRASKFTGFRAILSGPAGGVVGYARTTAAALGVDPATTPVIGFDMGGTSTDVSRFAGTSLDHVLETETAGVKIQCPQLDVNTVAAGGGSRLFFRQGALAVGPESAKAHPGPVCYRKQDGKLALTDANLMLGRLLPNRFPKIFGPNEDEPLDVNASRRDIEKVAAEVDTFFGRPSGSTSPESLASGFVRVANEAMCRPIRELSEARGFNPRDHVLACFGGAGAQHVCALARTLGIRKAVVHAYAGILSAYGIGLADVVVDKLAPLGGSTRLDERRDYHADVEADARADLAAQGDFEQVRVERYLNLRYEGTDNALMVPEPPRTTKTYESAMADQFEREYGFELAGRKEVLVDDCRVRVVGATPDPRRAVLEPAARVVVEETCRVYFDETGWVEETPVFELSRLGAGAVVDGPAILAVGTSTCVVEPRCTATVTRHGDLVLDISSSHLRDEEEAPPEDRPPDPARLGVFSHRFMSIAEQMGRTLQRTATSVNIKERLDFSCALFSADGALVANAPHVPVHLGAMSETVKAQLAKTKMGPGDVLVANDPNAGGSHLPDITVITPVFFFSDDTSPAFFCASRGHHADVGGSTPGSMPADSTTLDEEGAVIDAFKLVKNGVFDEAGILALLASPASKPPPPDKPHLVLSGCRNAADVVSDLKAQVAANSKGATLLRDLCSEYGRPQVAAYMRHVRANAAACVRAALSEVAGGAKRCELRAEDRMDDGNPIALELAIDCPSPDTVSAVFDFSGTGPQVLGNWNAPRAITSAAVMYCLRLIVGRDIPLNSGCLDPVEIRIETPSMLSPAPTAAVCAGNVLTSMRVTDVVLKALGACAASQGCMNNLSFGEDESSSNSVLVAGAGGGKKNGFGYYETIAGGAGAGPSWHGTSAIQCHMTNTRITDVETLERRYPVLLDEFRIRRGSGGRGKFRGGDGVVRQLTFLRDGLVVSLLTERRALAPFGINGGGDALRGVNTLIARGGTNVSLGPKTKIIVRKGDKLRVETPGGGGYGALDDDEDRQQDREPTTTSSRHKDATVIRRTASTALGTDAIDF
ncbi:hypothetical protein CTAYLR_009942 [Chrysophaeum taylorii]|uniref:5-oxoprolinase n=1 Tax=Chrysophaeum taylorii TaxID=2483200 RepID=A0AAD7UFT0_9STRA|nr:hypothetical protein CTAYLR_009942 [Chrysophaeum taylorii]